MLLRFIQNKSRCGNWNSQSHSHTAVPTLAVLTMLLAQPIFLSRNFPTLNNRNSRTSLQLHNPPALIRVSPQRTPIIASSGCFGCFVKPLDVRTKTSLGAFFKKRKGCAHICHSLKEESEVGGNGNNGRDWTTSILLFLLWAALMYYVFFLTPNQTPVCPYLLLSNLQYANNRLLFAATFTNLNP